jgi:hypothetical protein
MKTHIFVGALLIGLLPVAAAATSLTMPEKIAIGVLAAIGWYAYATAAWHRLQAQKIAIVGGSKPSDLIPRPVEEKPQDDFLFGRIYRTEKGDEHYLGLSDAVNLAKHETPTTFTAHIKRLLDAQPNNAIVLMGETSYPEINGLLDKLPSEHIGRVVIRARTDMNSAVKATLECSIHTVHGAIHVRPHWTAWKPTREEEVIETLLVPLVAHCLIGRLYLEVAGKPKPFTGSLNELIEAVLKLTGYPYLRRNDNDDRMTDYIQRLIQAQKDSSLVIHSSLA